MGGPELKQAYRVRHISVCSGFPASQLFELLQLQESSSRFSLLSQTVGSAAANLRRCVPKSVAAEKWHSNWANDYLNSFLFIPTFSNACSLYRVAFPCLGYIAKNVSVFLIAGGASEKLKSRQRGGQKLPHVGKERMDKCPANPDLGREKGVALPGTAVEWFTVKQNRGCLQSFWRFFKMIETWELSGV